MLGKDQDRAADDGRGLLALAQQFGTDKVPNCPTYDLYLGPLRHKNVNLLEIGIGGYADPRAGGSSLRMWREYFSNGNVYALDFYDKSPHREDRIFIYQGSQEDPAILKQIASDMHVIDVIIDDGSHVSSHIIKSFEVLFPLLTPGGLYIVEDIGTSYWPDYGGSEDFLNPNTSVSYFKRLVDGVQHRHFKHAFSPSYADIHTQYIHFYNNFIVIKKASD